MAESLWNIVYGFYLVSRGHRKLIKQPEEAAAVLVSLFTAQNTVTAVILIGRLVDVDHTIKTIALSLFIMVIPFSVGMAAYFRLNKVGSKVIRISSIESAVLKRNSYLFGCFSFSLLMVVATIF